MVLGTVTMLEHFAQRFRWSHSGKQQACGLIILNYFGKYTSPLVEWILLLAKALSSVPLFECQVHSPVPFAIISHQPHCLLFSSRNTTLHPAPYASIYAVCPFPFSVVLPFFISEGHYRVLAFIGMLLVLYHQTWYDQHHSCLYMYLVAWENSSAGQAFSVDHLYLLIQRLYSWILISAQVMEAFYSFSLCHYSSLGLKYVLEGRWCRRKHSLSYLSFLFPKYYEEKLTMQLTGMIWSILSSITFLSGQWIAS